jgi:hypothetical protein
MLSVITGRWRHVVHPEGLNCFTVAELLAPIATARLCGIEYLPPYVIHGTHRSARRTSMHGRRYRARDRRAATARSISSGAREHPPERRLDGDPAGVTMHQDFFQAFVYPLAAVVSVPIAKRLGGAVLVTSSPASRSDRSDSLGTDSQDICTAEFGVVMMLFVVG